jgi:hypothetical protein
MVLRGQSPHSSASVPCCSLDIPIYSPTGLPLPAHCPGGLSPENVIPYRWTGVSVDCTSLSPHIDRIESKIEPTDPTTSSAVCRPCHSLTAGGNTSLVQRTTRTAANLSLWLVKHCVATALNGASDQLHDPAALSQRKELPATIRNVFTVRYGLHLCVPYGSHSNQRLFTQTALTSWAL